MMLMVSIPDQITKWRLKMKAITKTTSASLSVFAAAAITALRETGRSTKIVRYGDAPVVPYEEAGFLYQTLEPAEKYTLPKEVLRRIAVLDENEIPYTHIITAHEIPKVKPKPKPRVKPLEIQTEVPYALPDVLTALGWIVVGLLGILAFPVVVIGTLIVGVVMYDPIVYVRLASGEWLEIANWYE